MYSRITVFLACAQLLDVINLAAAQGMFRMADVQTAIPFPIYENSPGITIYLRFTARKCKGNLLEITSEISDQFFLLSLKSSGKIHFFFKTSMGSGKILIHPPPGNSFCNGRKYLLTVRRYLDDIQYRVNRGKRFRSNQQVLKAPFPKMNRIKVGFGFNGCVSGIDVLYYRSRTVKHTMGISKGCSASKKLVPSSYPTKPKPQSTIKKESESRALPSTRLPAATKQLPTFTKAITQTITQSSEERTYPLSTVSTRSVASSNDVTRSNVQTDSVTIQETTRVTQSSPVIHSVTKSLRLTLPMNISTRRSTHSPSRITALKASKIKIPSCRQLPSICAGLGYRQTIASTKYVKSKLRHFLPFIRANCSVSLKDFLCAYFFPSCPHSKSSSVQPCRELCLKTKYECAPLMKAFQFEWSVNCESLLSRNEGKCLLSNVKTTEIIPTTSSRKEFETDATELSNEIIVTLRPVIPFNIKPTRKNQIHCGGIFRQPTGHISTPNYPDPYPSNAICQWAIILPEVYRLINFILEVVSLEFDPNCGYDYLLFKDGLSNQVGPKLCGFMDRPRLVTIKGHIAVVVFKSDSALNKKGVFIKYEAHSYP